MNKDDDGSFDKGIKLIELQGQLISLLSDYYMRTDELTRDIQNEMIPDAEPQSCECCDEPVYPILHTIHRYEDILENFDSIEIDEMDLGITHVEHPEYPN